VEIISNLIIVVLGVWFVISYKKLATKTVNFYSKFPVVRVSEKVCRIAFLGGGIIGIIFGLLSIFKFI